MWLNGKLQRWQDAGIIDGSIRERIEAFEHSKRKPVALFALGVLGGGTVALGLISIIAANWDGIAGRVKIGIDLVLLMALGAAAAQAQRRGRVLVLEILITATYGFTLASLALVGQVYQLGTPAYQGLLVWSAATLPLVLLGQSRFLAVLVLLGLVLTQGFAFEALARFLDRHLSPSAELNLGAAVLYASPFAYILLGRLPWLARQRPEFAGVTTRFGWVVIFGMGFALQFMWYANARGHDQITWGIIPPGVLTAGVLFALPRLYRELPVGARRALGMILVFAWLAFAMATMFPRGATSAVGAVLQVVWLCLFALAALRLHQMHLFNILTALVGLRVLVIYFELFGSLMSTGAGLITGGLLTLLLAWFWWRKTRRPAGPVQNPASGEGAHVA